MTGSLKSYRTKVILLITISTLVRAFLASTLELGNDEVYYRLYALYPDWSHFDHPPMVGILIQLFSLNLLFDGEFAIRLGAVIIGAINLWLIYRIGARIKDERTGFYAALLYAGTIYGSVITGVFIMPDTPQGLFWLISIYLMTTTLSAGPELRGQSGRMLLLGLTLGLGMLSKYTTVFLWLGVALYVSLFRRQWIRSPYLYAAAFISLLCILPVLYWNFQHDFISFTFHGSRLETSGASLHIDYFFREVFGEMLYNNPLNIGLILYALIRISQGNFNLKKAYQAILVLSALPLIISFLIFSLFRETLPHWSAPAYMTLILLAAVTVSGMRRHARRWSLGIAVGFTVVVVIAGYLQIQYGILRIEEPDEYTRLGKNDASLDLYGYRQTGEAFDSLVRSDVESGRMPENSVLFGDNWFPLANYDYYAATPAGIDAMAIADMDHLHKYAWINRELGGFRKGMSGYYISDSRYYRIPQSSLSRHFESTEVADTIPVYRSGRVVKRVFVWRLKNLEILPEDPLE